MARSKYDKYNIVVRNIITVCNIAQYYHIRINNWVKMKGSVLHLASGPKIPEVMTWEMITHRSSHVWT